jgi:hypothetical protein
MTKIVKDCQCSESLYIASSEMRNCFAKAENLQDKAYDRVEGGKLSV